VSEFIVEASMTSSRTIGTKLSRPGSAVIGVVGWRLAAPFAGSNRPRRGARLLRCGSSSSR